MMQPVPGRGFPVIRSRAGAARSKVRMSGCSAPTLYDGASFEGWPHLRGDEGGGANDALGRVPRQCLGRMVARESALHDAVEHRAVQPFAVEMID